MHVHQTGVGGVPISPHLFEQHISSKHLPRFARQRHQQVELQRGQRDLLAVAGHLVGGHVDLDVADRQHLGGLVLVAAQPGAHPGHQFLGLERLHHVVVGAGLQAEHHVDGVGLGGQHHDRHTGVRAQHPADVDAVHAGQHQVEQHQVGPQFAHRGQRLRAVGDHRGVETLVAQDDGEHLGQRGVVVDDQNPLPHGVHGVTESRQSPASTRRVATSTLRAMTGASAAGSTSGPTTDHGPRQCRGGQPGVHRAGALLQAVVAFVGVAGPVGLLRRPGAGRARRPARPRTSSRSGGRAAGRASRPYSSSPTHDTISPAASWCSRAAL